MDEKDWTLLVNLNREGNITKTAKKLYISQPSLTYRIKQIENEFNINLIYRGNKGIIFTSEGELLVQYAVDMLKKLNYTKDKLSNVGDEVKGKLSLGVSSNFALYTLPELLEGFLEKYPNIEIQLNTGWSSRIIDYMNNDNIHIGILRGEQNWKDGQFQIKSENLCVVSKNKIQLQDLPQLNYIRYHTDTQLKNTFENWWRENYDTPPKVSMEVDRIETAKELVKRGLGYSLIPSISLRENDDLFTINLKIDNEEIKRNTWMFYRKNLLELNVVGSFVQYIHDYYQGS